MMSSIRTTVHESLPYIDAEPTPTDRAAAEALIAAEISSFSSEDNISTSPLPPIREPQFSALIQSELERIASKSKLAAIDTSRYEALSLPQSSTASLTDLQSLLAKAYTSSSYLSARHTNLSLLDTFGKNAWLTSNWQTEAELQALERELAEAKREIEIVNNDRRKLQQEVGGEMTGLEESWKKGVGRVVETELAVEELRRLVLERRKAGSE